MGRLRSHRRDRGRGWAGRDPGWAVFDESAAVVDHSGNLTAEEEKNLLDVVQSELSRDSNEEEGTIHTHIQRGDREYLTAFRAAESPKPIAERGEFDRSRLAVVVMLSNASLQQKVDQLALLVGGLSIGTFLIAAIAGRWYCIKALRPVRVMAHRALP